MPTPHNPPAAVHALSKLEPTSTMPVGVGGYQWPSWRSALHFPTYKVEAGDTNVSIGIYAGVLQALGLLDGLSQIADISNDSVGQALASAELPKHVHLKRPAGSSRDG